MDIFAISAGAHFGKPKRSKDGLRPGREQVTWDARQEYCVASHDRYFL